MNQILPKIIDVKYHLSVNLYLTPNFLSHFKQVHIVYCSLYLQFLIVSDKKLICLKLNILTFMFGFYYKIENMVNISAAKLFEPTENSG